MRSGCIKMEHRVGRNLMLIGQLIKKGKDQ